MYKTHTCSVPKDKHCDVDFRTSCLPNLELAGSSFPTVRYDDEASLYVAAQNMDRDC